jgi:hypothetical protein
LFGQITKQFIKKKSVGKKINHFHKINILFCFERSNLSSVIVFAMTKMKNKSFVSFCFLFGWEFGFIKKIWFAFVVVFVLRKNGHIFFSSTKNEKTNLFCFVFKIVLRKMVIFFSHQQK